MVNYPKMDREAIFRIVSDYQAALNKRLLPKTKGNYILNSLGEITC